METCPSYSYFRLSNRFMRNCSSCAHPLRRGWLPRRCFERAFYFEYSSSHWSWRSRSRRGSSSKDSWNGTRNCALPPCSTRCSWRPCSQQKCCDARVGQFARQPLFQWVLNRKNFVGTFKSFSGLWVHRRDGGNYCLSKPGSVGGWHVCPCGGG